MWGKTDRCVFVSLLSRVICGSVGVFHMSGDQLEYLPFTRQFKVGSLCLVILTDFGKPLRQFKLGSLCLELDLDWVF